MKINAMIERGKINKLAIGAWDKRKANMRGAGIKKILQRRGIFLGLMCG